MDIYNLDENQVQRLIRSLKLLQDDVMFDDPLIGKIKDDHSLTDYENDIEYKFHRYRHPLDTKRFSMHIRFTESNDMLIRLDINNGTHRNPDGNVIDQNHIHIYNNALEQKDAYAYELPGEISNIETIIDAMIDFFEYTNIEYSGGDRNDHSG